MEYIFEKDLKDEKILGLCSNIFFYDKPERVKSNEYIRWFILDEQERAFAGGESLYTEYDIQVDIYSEGSYLNLANIIIKTLKEKGYNLIDNINSVVKKGDIKIYNKTLRFRFNKYNVKEGIN
ncbi:hypothetical protein [Clostridium sp.]|jgi:hypothetical protein|uniref:hypothetical protein n=1 Tax=Clostridium sp. TaxID=1506 RepID=UPI002067F9E1|nr:hypothetical protein [Clostridium celatum]DAU94882.1 MAG TPA: tail component [Caudoviricetes sp.]